MIIELQTSVLSIFNKLKKDVLDINNIRSQLITNLSIKGEIADASPAITYMEDMVTFHFIELKECKQYKNYYVIIDKKTGEKEFHVTNVLN